MGGFVADRENEWTTPMRVRHSDFAEAADLFEANLHHARGVMAAFTVALDPFRNSYGGFHRHLHVVTTGQVEGATA